MSYQRIPLFLQPDWYRGGAATPLVQVSGILRSGVPSGATIKAAVKMRECTEEEAEEEPEPQEREGAATDDPGDEQAEEEAKEKDKKKEKVPDISLDDSPPEEEEDDGGTQKKEEKKKEKYEEVLETCQKLLKECPYSMFKTRVLKNMQADASKTYRVRLYLLTAQNLTATGVYLDWKSRIAGMTALSAANPYPVVSINNGVTGKLENDRDAF